MATTKAGTAAKKTAEKTATKNDDISSQQSAAAVHYKRKFHRPCSKRTKKIPKKLNGYMVLSERKDAREIFLVCAGFVRGLHSLAGQLGSSL